MVDLRLILHLRLSQQGWLAGWWQGGMGAAIFSLGVICTIAATIILVRK